MFKSSGFDFINQMFPAEASLSGVEPFMLKIHNEIRRVDATILAAVRQQSNSETKAKDDLADAICAVEELSHKIQEIKSKAEQTEAMVQDVCREIKKLDFAKKNITTAVTALHRLTMVVSAVEQLQVMTSKRQYKEAAVLLEVFQRVLQAYATKLFLKLSKGGTRKQLKVSGIDERVICYIVSSAEYCRKTSGDLAEEVSTIIDLHYADGVDMSEVQDEYSCGITKALVTLVRGLETKYDTEMQEMARVSWGTLESVGDHSQYVNGIYIILNNFCPQSTSNSSWRR